MISLSVFEVFVAYHLPCDFLLDVCLYALKESNALVEEWMLLANITVAKKTLRHFPSLSVLRRHCPPSREQFLPLEAAAAAVVSATTIHIASYTIDSSYLEMNHSGRDLILTSPRRRH